MQLHWSGSTRYHDWHARPRTTIRSMLSLARQAGVVGALDWVSAGHDGEQEKVAGNEGVLDELLDRRAEHGESLVIEAGGAGPVAWKMSLLLFPFQKALGQVRGYNILNLWFEGDAFFGPGGSDKLVRAFRAIHIPDNTEFAFIHPYKRWSELTDLGAPYEDPVTIGPMFSGVYWATFLGRGHLSFFHLDRLRDVRGYEIDWMGEDGLFIRVSRDVAGVTGHEVEKEMFRLTGMFRSALR